MKASSLIRCIAILAIASSIIPTAMAGSRLHDVVIPRVFSMPPIVAPGEVITIEVDLDQNAPADQVVVISSMTTANWSSLPSIVVVPAGQMSVHFTATVSKSATGSIDGIATCNGTSVSGSQQVISY